MIGHFVEQQVTALSAIQIERLLALDATLTRLDRIGGARPPIEEAAPKAVGRGRGQLWTEPVPETLLQRAERLIQARRTRMRSFGEFSDFATGPAWAILLDLVKAREAHGTVSVSSACLASGAPATTGLRHLDALHKAGMIERVADPFDRRRVFVKLTPRANAMLNEYLASL